jgi:ribosomal protein S20
MANTKNAKKAQRQSDKRYHHNKSIRSRVGTFLRICKESLLKSVADFKASLSQYESAAMKAAKSNVVEKAAVSRTVSRLVAKAKKNFADQY